jgi:hypothetical protein
MVNGIGRQPPTIRRVDHVDNAVNLTFDIASGVKRREGFESIKYYDATDLAVIYGSDVATEWVDRDASTRYVIIWKEDQGRANGSADATIPFDILDLATGTKATVGWAAGDGTSTTNRAISDYLNFLNADVTGTAAAASNLVMTTAGDTTFVVNNSVTVLADTTNPNIIDLNTGVNLGELKDSPQGHPDDPPGSVGYYWADKDEINNIDILQLGPYYQYTVGSGTAYHGGSYSNKEYTPRWVTDAGQLVSQYFGYDNSPVGGIDPHGTNEVYVWVKGSSAFGPLGWRKGTRASGTDRWVWTMFPPLDVENCYLDTNTMPIRLVRQPDGTFELSQNTWAPRYNGDEETNPAPSFLG